jgi:hypothetical protein
MMIPINQDMARVIGILLLLNCISLSQSTHLIVKAEPGDTVERIAIRFGADPAEVAKFNGLLPGSVLGAGREVKIPRTALKSVANSTARSLSSCYFEEKLDRNREILPTDFLGHDLAKIASILRERGSVQKDEFETTQQFLGRKKALESKPLLRALTVSDTFALLLDKAVFTYDADAEEMQVEFRFSEPSVVISKTCGGYYTGVAKSEFKFITSAGSPLRTNWFARFPVKLSLARELKPRLRALAFITFVKSAESDLLNYSSRDPAMSVRILETWVFDSSTGKVLFKPPLPASEAESQEAELKSLLERATKYYKEGNDEEAMSLLRRVLASEPMSAESYLILGKIHLRRGDIDQAISSFKTSVFWDKRLREGHLALARIYVERGDCLQAKNYIASVLEVSPQDPEGEALKQRVARCF